VDVSSDGRYVLYRRNVATAGTFSLWALDITHPDMKPFPIPPQTKTTREGQFSPDVKWIAFQESDETSPPEIYVQRFPGGEDRVLVSAKGGAQVRWRSNGKELFYIALDGTLMAVPIRVTESGPPDAGDPAPLFTTHIGGAIQGVLRQQYCVSSDGQRFLMNTLVDDDKTPGITLLLNWKPTN